MNRPITIIIPERTFQLLEWEKREKNYSCIEEQIQTLIYEHSLTLEEELEIKYGDY